MVEFGAVSIEWGTVLIRFFIFFMPLALVIACCLFILKRTATKQKAIDELEKRVAALEQQIKRPKS
ncbi:hypothetical protein [Brevibacillus brevis]|uniref:hypothetical protein n=1 Tax=Brevibacillus brevis TaxID=1393 RepID=UPI000D10B7F4|nr:hypothetical protein [Brevibacillus brevis]PSJ66502.1 hypothetical protein C7J99_25485 [Brevibacillus brevis]RED24076.1 hypothetical protein DES34_114100 [Brevibacillus brevis]GEC92287.1 hypothetical protein BBR01nite_46180 [Brevibacillus brevis]VEF90269.1 Uncharacterised protein [Brevibacillus brevis]